MHTYRRRLEVGEEPETRMRNWRSEYAKFVTAVIQAGRKRVEARLAALTNSVRPPSPRGPRRARRRHGRQGKLSTEHGVYTGV